MALKSILESHCQHCGRQQVRVKPPRIWSHSCGCKRPQGPQSYPRDFGVGEVLISYQHANHVIANDFPEVGHA